MTGMTHLEHEELAALRRLVEKRRAQLTGELRSDAQRARDESFAEVAGEVRDAGDESFADLVSDVDQAELSRDLTELRDLEAALTRFLTGSYGKCCDCDIAIDFARLRAEPTALRCIECQRIHEKQFAQQSTPKL